MPRKLNEELIKKLKTGEFSFILDYVKREPELSIEIRLKSQAMIYYKKAPVLTMTPQAGPKILHKNYFKHQATPMLDVYNPGPYFVKSKQLVDKHSGGSKKEFEVQQKISLDNSNLSGRFLVIDMEYQFDQKSLINRTKQRTCFDLLAIDSATNQVVLFELKNGTKALHGKSGIQDHFIRFKEHVVKPEFRNALRADVKSIVSDKVELGILPEAALELTQNLTRVDIEFKMIYASGSTFEIERMKQNREDEFETIYLDTQNDPYILH